MSFRETPIIVDREIEFGKPDDKPMHFRGEAEVDLGPGQPLIRRT